MTEISTVPEADFIHIFWRVLLGIVGVMILAAESINWKECFFSDDDQKYWKSVNASVWFFLAVLLLAEAIGFSSLDALCGMSALVPGGRLMCLRVFPYVPQSHVAAPYLFAIGLLRLIYARMFDFSPNKDKLLVAHGGFDLIGEEGELLTSVGISRPGRVRLENPAYKGDIIECIADEALAAGVRVKIVMIDVGLAKVEKIND